MKNPETLMANACVEDYTQNRTAATQGISHDDFYAFMPTHSYIFVPTREMWPVTSVNARLQEIDGLSASKWLDKNRAVDQMTWAPGEPTEVRGRLIFDGGWIKRPDVTCFNQYRPPLIELGDPENAKRWIDHIRSVYPDAADHIIKWLAHRVQKPAEKVNHALVLGGAQGIGKDTLLEPVKQAVGPWNFGEVSPGNMLERFNGFVKNVILRVSEARDLGDVDRFAFYDHIKAYTAAPPDVLRCDEKHVREYKVPNVVGVIITTNHKLDGVYLPSDDRRHYVAWSDKTKDDFTPAYWTQLWNWYDRGGCRDVAAYLSMLDLSGFNAKSPPPKTPAFWDIVDANRAPEDAELQDAIDALGNPNALSLAKLINKASPSLAEWLRQLKNRRKIPSRLEEVGYVRERNRDAEDGLWKFPDGRQAIYVKKELSVRHRSVAANDFFDR